MALPEDLQESEPAFAHFPANTIPVVEQGSDRVAIVIGSHAGIESPVSVPARTLLLIVTLGDGAVFDVPEQPEERAIYVIDGRIDINGCALGPGDMAVLNRGPLCVSAEGPTRLALFAGEPLGRRHIWWNFVHTDRERIEQAKGDWKGGRFPAVPGDAEAFIPLPQD
jgi:hypothetical protein